MAIEEAEKEDPLAKEGILEGLAGLLPPGPLGRPLEYIWEISVHSEIKHRKAQSQPECVFL